MSGIEEAIRRLEEIADRHICAARREELLEIIEILRHELERKDDLSARRSDRKIRL